MTDPQEEERSRLPICPFRVGDVVRRGNIGAMVPERGKGVMGWGSGPNSESSIRIDTSEDGVVTIRGTEDGVPFEPEVCVLAD